MSVATNSSTMEEILLQMLKQYDAMCKKDGRSPEEFVKECICTQKLFVENNIEAVVDSFLKICNMRTFFTAILSHANICQSDAALVLLYTFLFNISNATANNFLNCLKTCLPSPREQNKFVKFFFKPDRNVVLDSITSVANKIYDVDYSSFITKSMSERLELMDHLREDILTALKTDRQPTNRNNVIMDKRTSLTLCTTPSFMIKYPPPPVPQNTAANSLEDTSINNPCCSKLEDTTKLNKDIEQTQRKERISKRQKALGKEIKLECMEICKPSKPQKRISSDTIATFKVNKATLLRTGAQVNQKLDQAKKLLDGLESGSYSDPWHAEAVSKSKYIESTASRLRDIERKRLFVLMTHEDAKLAKFEVFERNHARAYRVKREKAELRKRLNHYRRQEMSRLMRLVGDNFDSLEVAKGAQLKCIEEKQRMAKSMADELNHMKEQVIKRRQQELSHKAELIREIRQCEQVKREMKDCKKVDKLQSSSSGLLSEMSLCQLQQALKDIKNEIERQTRLQNEKIQRERCRQRELLTETITKVERFSNLPKNQRRCVDAAQTLRQDKELIELRNKLEEKRQLARLKSFTSIF